MIPEPDAVPSPTTTASGGPLRVVIAPDSFKGSLSATEAAAALARGWRAVRPDDVILTIPIADGGEGTLDVFSSAVPEAVRNTLDVTGPDGRPATAGWLALPGGTAVVELAQASGLPLMAELDPLKAQTVGLGETIAAALDAGSRRILVALGGSASTDGGTGLLTALGARFLDSAGRPLPPGGGSLRSLATVDLTGLRAAPPDGVHCLVDVDAPLLGPTGAAAVFGPQKGAGRAEITLLDAGLARLVECMEQAGAAAGLAASPGAGAAGGTAYGLAAALGATLVPGAITIAEHAGLRAALAGADLLITGEGRFDQTSLAGKVVGAVAALAAGAGLPLVVVAGQIAADPPAGGHTLALTDLAGGRATALAQPVHWLEEAGLLLARRNSDGVARAAIRRP
ncbi:glycerate kinase [Parafrankia discariae]|uniref:glycerate kinase n=1 Tax=Parafrankia discariae TaxID=365528 RepID=UPI000361C677|nr:glycerate kinase [Parafrankia discariae]